MLTFEYEWTCFTLRHLMLYIIFLSFRLQIYLLNSVACLYLSFPNEHTWFLHLNLKVVSQSPMFSTLHAATCVCRRNSASYPLTIFPSSTRNLSWSLNVVMRTSSSQQPIRTGAIPTVLKFQILSL